MNFSTQQNSFDPSVNNLTEQPLTIHKEPSAISEEFPSSPDNIQDPSQVKKPKKIPVNSIFIKNLYFDNEQDADTWIQALFSQHGTIDHKKIFPFKPGRFSAVITYATQDEADKAYSVLSQSVLTFPNGQNAFVNWHTKKYNKDSQKVYIKNLRLDTDRKDLLAVVSTCGKVESIALENWESKDKTRKAKFGFIRFTDGYSSWSFIRNPPAELQNFAVPEGPVEVCAFQSKTERLRYREGVKEKRWNEYMASQKLLNPKFANKVQDSSN